MRSTVIGAVLVFLLIFCTACTKKEVSEEQTIDASNPKTDFIYTTALEYYGQDIAQKAVNSGEISSINSIIIRKYIGRDENIVIPKTIDGHPVELIDNFAFSPYDFSIERDNNFWANELAGAGLKTEGNGSGVLDIGNFICDNFQAFIDAIVSTKYQEDGITGDKYQAIENYYYYDKDFEKVINYLKNRPKSSHIKKVVISENVISIGGGAFMFCDSLESVEFARHRIRCNDFAFAFCTSLKEIRSSLTADVDGCFLGCISLERAIIKAHHLGGYMFAGCINLEYLSVARETKYSKKYSLYRCPKLKTCNFPIDFKIGPEFVDFTTFTARLSKEDASYDLFEEKGYPYTNR